MIGRYRITDQLLDEFRRRLVTEEKSELTIAQYMRDDGRRPAARHRARLPGAAGLLRAVGAQRRVARAFRGGGAHLRDLLPRQAAPQPRVPGDGRRPEAISVRWMI